MITVILSSILTLKGVEDLMKKTNLSLKNKIFATIKKWVMFFLNPRLLLCFFIAWMITNGWCYIFAAVGALCEISWMLIAGTVYMGFLWIPCTPEKILTVVIALGLMKLIFPKDVQTIGTLKEEINSIKNAVKKQFDKNKKSNNVA